MGYEFELSNEMHTVHPVHTSGRRRLSIGDRAFAAELFPGLVDGEHFLEIEGRQERIFIAVHGDAQFIHWRGQVHRVEAVNALERARRAAAPSGGAEEVRAPMPGTVVDIAVVAGDHVETGQLLMTIESMKLQTAIYAPHDATVDEVFVSAGATFDQGAALVRLDANATEGDDKEQRR